MNDPRIAPSIFTRGAVDLGALSSSSSPATARPADAPSGLAAGGSAGSTPDGPGGARTTAVQSGPEGARRPGTGVVVIDVTEATFSSEVLERSRTTPVVVDFWAEWCTPCKQLSPVLEKLALEGNGAWILAKIDVDVNPRIAQMFQVQGIPMVCAIVGGQPVDAFSGVVPESQLRLWLDAILKAGGVEVEIPVDPRLTAADDAMMAGDIDGAEKAYQKILSESPANAVAEAGLAQVGLLRRAIGVDARAALEKAQADPDDVPAQLLAADLEVLGGRAPQAYARLVDLIRRTSGDDRTAVRTHLVSLFLVADPDDPAVAAARRSLASALF